MTTRESTDDRPVHPSPDELHASAISAALTVLYASARLDREDPELDRRLVERMIGAALAELMPL